MAASDNALRSGSGRFRLGRLGSGGNPGRVIRPAQRQNSTKKINLLKKKRLLFIYQFSITAQDGQSSHSVLQIVGLDNHPPGSVVAGLKPAAPGFSGARGLKD